MDVLRNDPVTLQVPVTEEHSSPGKWINVNVALIINVNYGKQMEEAVFLNLVNNSIKRNANNEWPLTISIEG